jgi:hypothetical protein
MVRWPSQTDARLDRPSRGGRRAQQTPRRHLGRRSRFTQCQRGCRHECCGVSVRCIGFRKAGSSTMAPENILVTPSRDTRSRRIIASLARERVASNRSHSAGHPQREDAPGAPVWLPTAEPSGKTARGSLPAAPAGGEAPRVPPPCATRRRQQSQRCVGLRHRRRESRCLARAETLARSVHGPQAERVIEPVVSHQPKGAARLTKRRIGRRLGGDCSQVSHDRRIARNQRAAFVDGCVARLQSGHRRCETSAKFARRG